MVRFARHAEAHAVGRLGWLRAAVLGANDGILSTSSLIIGVASAHGTHQSVLIASVSGLVAGAMSMASGEYVSVSSQSDSELADIAREDKELRLNRVGETRELAEIYVKRGLDTTLATTVAEQLMMHDALGAHTRDELGISDMTAARPVQAALASAAAFSAGGAPPLLIALVTPTGFETVTVSVASLVFLVVLGAVGAGAGGANMMKAAIRVTFWGALAMAVTAGIGAVFGAHV
jgi:VIT1/CCC1 family predicted Fe2+/Mn2+ transporter